MAVPVEELPEALTGRVAFLLQLALARAQALGEQALLDLDLGGREYGVLALLEHPAAASQQQLGATLGIDRTTTMTLLAGLEARGLVRRERDPGNRRAYLVTLTGAGDELRARAAAVLAECDERFLAPLPPGQRNGLRAALRRLL